MFEFKTPWGAIVKAEAREGTIDWNTLQSCITEDEYRVAKLPDGGVAIDVGAYIGGCTLALVAKGYQVFAVEPLPENCELLAKNIKLNDFDEKVGIYEAAASSSKDPLDIYYFNTGSELGKQHEFIGIPHQDERGGRKISVPTVSIDHIIKENDLEKVDFLKMDIEGGEWDVIGSISEESLDKIGAIAVEIDSLDGKPTSTTKFLKLLKDKFVDFSPSYFPDWCAPGMSVHGYYINKNLL